MNESLINFTKKRLWPLIAVVVFLIYTLSSFNVYLARTLNGDINKHILAGEMFGTPSKLAERGLTPLYYGPGQTGWDGQFYYYMANDVLADEDTAEHIDNPPYRYQRIGLSLFVSMGSSLFGNGWVSPVFYFLTYLCLISCATYAGARLLQDYKAPPALVLLWSLSVGTQVTLFNALPDAAADAFLIIGLLALHKRFYFFASLFILFAALSREIYVFFPAALYGVAILKTALQNNSGCKFNKIIELVKKIGSKNFLILPIVGVLAWQLFIYFKFGRMAGSDAPGILGVPLLAWWKYFASGISGVHILVGSGAYAYFEAFCLLMFLLILSVFMAVALSGLKRFLKNPNLVCGVISAGFVLSIVYISFGPTVIMHYTGYFKALSIFFFLLPFVIYATDCRDVVKKLIIGILVAAFLGSSVYQMRVRIMPEQGFDRYTNFSKISVNNPIDCFPRYEAAVEIKQVQVVTRDFLNYDPLLVFKIRLTNTGQYPLVSSLAGHGSVNLSYHWLDDNGQVIQDGIRTALPNPLLTNESMDAYIVSPFPKKRSRLIVSPVQEGCGWFYSVNPKSGSEFSVLPPT